MSAGLSPWERGIEVAKLGLKAGQAVSIANVKDLYSVKVYVVSSESSFIKAVETALRSDEVGVYGSTTEALDEILGGVHTNKLGMVVLDLTSATEADRLINFLKWSSTTNHVLIIGVGHDSDFTALEAGALRLLDGAVRAPFTRFQLAAAVNAALSVRTEQLRA